MVKNIHAAPSPPPPIKKIFVKTVVVIDGIFVYLFTVGIAQSA
jgi:hypothetical protein